MITNSNSFPCYYPIFWLPPTIFHYNSAQILSGKPEVSSVIIVIPNIETDYLNQDQAAELFEKYLEGAPMADVKVIKAPQKNSLSYIKDLYRKDPNLESFIALDEKTARSPEFNTVFSPNENLDIQLVPSTFEKSSNKMKEAIETGNKEQFYRYLPQNLTYPQREACWSIVHSEIEEEIVKPSYCMKIFEKLDITK